MSTFARGRGKIHEAVEWAQFYAHIITSVLRPEKHSNKLTLREINSVRGSDPRLHACTAGALTNKANRPRMVGKTYFIVTARKRTLIGTAMGVKLLIATNCPQSQ